VLFIGEYLWLERPLDSYVIYYNITLTEYPFFENAHGLEIKRALDLAMLQQAAAEFGDDLQIKLPLSWRSFPRPKPRIHSVDVVA